jgi:hypothetical protein
MHSWLARIELPGKRHGCGRAFPVNGKPLAIIVGKIHSKAISDYNKCMCYNEIYNECLTIFVTVKTFIYYYCYGEMAAIYNCYHNCRL